MTARSTKKTAAAKSADHKGLSSEEYQTMLKGLQSNPEASLEEITTQIVAERLMLGAAIRHLFMKELAIAKIDPAAKFGSVCVLEDVLQELQLVPMKEAGK